MRRLSTAALFSALAACSCPDRTTETFGDPVWRAEDSVVIEGYDATLDFGATPLRAASERSVIH
jgi:hypothetical protein